MRQSVGIFTVGLLATLMLGAADGGPRTSATTSDSGDSVLITTSEVLRASLDRIAEGSALWRSAFAAVRDTNRLAVVVTPDDLPTLFPGHAKHDFDEDLLAEAIPVFNEAARVRAVVVVVNLRLLQSIHDTHASVPRQFESDLDRILVHEVYGHGVPYLLAGDSSGHCPDPGPGQSATEACSIRRENAVRTELRLGVRKDPGLFSLWLARELLLRGNH